MIYRILGKTSLKVSELGLGGAQIGGPSFINNKYIGSPKIETAEAYKILNLAFDNGINFYDTSDCYGDGKSEKYIGDTFSNKRDKLIIATKCGMTSSGERCFEREYIYVYFGKTDQIPKIGNEEVGEVFRMPLVDLVQKIQNGSLRLAPGAQDVMQMLIQDNLLRQDLFV